MKKLILSKLSLAELKEVINLYEGKVAVYAWTQVESIFLTDYELARIQDIQVHLWNEDTHLMNEATIWARAIYPLLLLAERDTIRAWAGVPLQACYPQFEIDGIADGVLGNVVVGRMETPYLIVVETKKGTENQTPVFQLYGQLLAAAYLNWLNNAKSQQEIFGCYTIADIWKFVRAEIYDINTDKPTMRLEYSREYTEKLEAELILKILKMIVANAK
jgi:hypothetical protein